MFTDRVTNGHVKREPKPLGLVWLNCSLYPVVSRGLAAILQKEANFICEFDPRVNEAPSVVVHCPNGEDLTKELKHLQKLVPNTPILVLGLHDDGDLTLARKTLQAEVAGFIHVGMKPSEIVRAIYLASKGETVVPRDFAMDLIKSLLKREELPDLQVLSSRQQEILNLVAQGLTNAQIAKQLFLSEYTIKQHLRAAYKHLKVRNRTEAAKLLRENA
jgi:DNA-binding NarL/FixJ family response regulator